MRLDVWQGLEKVGCLQANAWGPAVDRGGGWVCISWNWVWMKTAKRKVKADVPDKNSGGASV